jgi:epoxide hydrolase-like predicted phosphatase
MVKAVIFDFAGVVGGDGFWQWLLDRQDLLFQKKEKFEEIALAGARGDITSMELVDRLSRETGETQRDVWDGISEKCSVNPEMITFIRSLKPAYKTGLLTNFSQDWLEKILNDNEIADLFDPLVVSSSVKRIKPEKEIFQIMLRLLYMQPEETVFFDDRIANVEAAKKLGMHAFLFTTIAQCKIDLKSLGVVVKT